MWIEVKTNNGPLVIGVIYRHPTTLVNDYKSFSTRQWLALCYFAIWRQNSPNGYFAASAKIALNLIPTQTLALTQTLTLIATLTLTLTQTLTQTEEKHSFASGGKIATSFPQIYVTFSLIFVIVTLPFMLSATIILT